MRAFHLFFKRTFDIFGSLFGLIFLSPLFLAVAILIKQTSEGPVFFRQKRLGKNGRVFTIIKFRTMMVNAEQMGDGLRIKNENDFRISSVGRVLRRTSLDEIPQLFNVLKGEMSLVGPRPPVTYFPYKGYESYPDWAKKRFLMKPGMTGLSQVRVRNSVSWDEKIRIDIEYIEKFTIWLDIKIIFLTILKMFKPQNIYVEERINRHIDTKA